jgi:hypothetical protein
MELIDTFSMGDLATLAVLAVILFVGLLVLRVMFKLTATLFRLGCFAILLIVGAAALMIYL